ncbi:MAG: GntR family transcriptional regulator [Paenibacillus sp.]|jgi:multiple sugar transport system substrate-binding protein|nr:GntR family transcriptional regulator [Paenibacillus sp.]
MGSMQKNKRELIYTKLADTLRGQILSGEVKAGEFLLSENELCRIYGISRISVRKSFEILLQEGLIIKKVGLGTMVSSEVKGTTGTVPTRQTLKILSPSPSHFFKLGMTYIIEAFEREYPHVDVKLLELPGYNTWDSLDYLQEFGVNPDLIMVTDRMYKNLPNLDSFTRLNKAVERYSDLFYPRLLNYFTEHKSIFAVPITFSPVFMMYNPKLFGKFGVAEPQPDWSIEQLLDAAKQLSVDTNNDGIIDQFGLSLSTSSTRWTIIALQNGVDFKRIKENPEPLRKTLSMLHHLLYNDRVATLRTYSHSDRIYEPFIHGKAAMTLTTTIEAEIWRRETSGFNPLPVPVRMGPLPGTILVSNALMIPRTCSDPELAQAFIRSAVRLDVQEKISRTAGFLSVLMPVYDQIEDKSIIDMLSLKNSKLEHAFFMDEFLPDFDVLEQMEAEMRAFWNGYESVDEVMERLLRL